MVLGPMGVSYAGRRFPCSIGRSGCTNDKREGDGGTPTGVHHIVGMMYRADRMARPSGWATPIGPRDLWCDAPGHAAYNQLVKSPFSAPCETMRRGDPLYDLVLITDWNYPIAKAGHGSAIFLHRWQNPGVPTRGCIAFRPDHLLWIARNLAPGTRLIVPNHP
ncbi:L,D-transpeptidase family protein [Rhodobacteraceae bacterium]|nr:L,D-transpeptidase family protein [Paracoccaceae bacterium]